MKYATMTLKIAVSDDVEQFNEALNNLRKFARKHNVGAFTIQGYRENGQRCHLRVRTNDEVVL